MIRINLLPHRQLKREQRQREFGLMAAFTGIAAVAVVFLVYTFIGSQIEAQVSRNARLDAGIIKLDKEMVDIQDLKNQISVMLERKQVVENLQSNRGQAVVILDELSRQLPEGMYLKSIKQVGHEITLEGVADTNARVATLVRNLSTSKWMELPSLIEIKSVTINGIKQNAFTLKVGIVVAKIETESAATAAPKGGRSS